MVPVTQINPGPTLLVSCVGRACLRRRICRMDGGVGLRSLAVPPAKDPHPSKGEIRTWNQLAAASKAPRRRAQFFLSQLRSASGGG